MVDYKYLVIPSFLLLAAIGFFFIIGWQNPYVTADIPEEFSRGDFLKGQIVLTIEPGDEIPADTPVSISVIKNNEVLVFNSVSFKELVELSGKDIPITTKKNEEIYETPTSFSFPIEQIAEFKFEEKGKYEVIFAIFEKELIIKNDISIN